MESILQLAIYFIPLTLIIIDVKKRNKSKLWILGAVFLPIFLPIIYWALRQGELKTHKQQKEQGSYTNMGQTHYQAPQPPYPYQPPQTVHQSTLPQQDIKKVKQNNKGTPLRSFRTYVAGTKHKNSDGTSRQEILENCLEGDELLLIREPGNKHDSNAVKVCTVDGDQIGYLPAHIAQEIAPRLDKGSPVDAELIELRDSEEDIIYCTIELTKYRLR